jgi:hypothetical protein
MRAAPALLRGALSMQSTWQQELDFIYQCTFSDSFIGRLEKSLRRVLSVRERNLSARA